MNILMHVTSPCPPSFLFKKVVSSDKLPRLGLLGQRGWMFLWLSKKQADGLFPERLVLIYVATSHTRGQAPVPGGTSVFSLPI